MINLIKILLFSLVIILGFVGFARFGVPLVVPAAPPVEEKLTGDITMEQYIGVGDKIFNGKGTCTLCHNPIGGRAPLLNAVGAVASDRLKDERYKGEATNAEEYIRESMLNPTAFVVKGFGKKGSNDTISPMPNVSKGAIGLSEIEINAVIAYLQSISGVEVTVALPSGEAEIPEEEEQQEIQIAYTAVEALTKFECLACHLVPQFEEGGDIGPDLRPLATTAANKIKGYTAEQYIIESIINPNAFIVEDYEEDTMPEGFAEEMTVSELNVIVNGLLGRGVETGE